MTDIELWIRALVHEVESQGAHPILTDTVILLGDAQERFADWVDAGKPGAAS